MIKAVIFDLDDTLYNERDFVQAAFRDVALFLEKAYQVDRQALFTKMQEVLEDKGRGRIFNEVAQAFQLDVDIKQLVEIYRAAKPKLKLYEDADVILKWLKKNNYQTGIITDGLHTVQENKIRGLGLERKVDYIITTYAWGVEFQKPHKRAYEEMLKKLRLAPDECIYVGDNPAKDFIGARQVGMWSARIIRPFGDHMRIMAKEGYEADFRVNNLMEIKRVIKEI